MTIHDRPDNSFDALLSASLRRRPEAIPAFDLAAEAIDRAHALQVQEARLTRLARVRLWTRLATIAAGLLIVLTFAIGYRLLPAATTTSDSTTSTTTTTIDLTTVGIALFLITLIVVTLATLLTPDRPQLRLTPA